MQIISVPNYDFRKLQTGQILSIESDASSGSLTMGAVTGFVVNQFAVLGFDSDVEIAEIVQNTAIAGVVLSISTSAYWHDKDQLVYPTPYDQIEFYKKGVGASSFQLMGRKFMDVDGLETVFVDNDGETGDTYEYKYRNSVLSITGTASNVGLTYLHQETPYVTPAQVIEYMNHPMNLSVNDPNLIMLCAAYSDLFDHSVGRYEDERLWYHAVRVVVPMDNISANSKVRIPLANQKPVIDVLDAYVIDPKKGKKTQVDKPFEVTAKAILSFPELSVGDYASTDRLVLTLKVGFFDKNDIPSDLRMFLVKEIANHIRQEDLIRRYVHHSGQLVSGEAGVEALVKMVTVGKYRKSYFESASEGFGQRVNSKALRAMKIVFDDSLEKSNKDVFRRYKQTFSFTFL